MNDRTNSNPLEIDCRRVKQKLDDTASFLLLDCREPPEFALVNIAGSLLLPMSEITERIGELEEHREDEIIVYCHHGMRSLQVTLWLRDQGFERVTSMAGGIDQWSLEIDGSLPRY